jgi:hypothetical protein
MLVSADGGRIEHHVFAIGIDRQHLEYTFENAAFAPSPEALVRCLPIPETLRKIAPWNASAVPVNDRLNEQTIVSGGSTDMPLPAGQKILDPVPLIVT